MRSQRYEMHCSERKYFLKGQKSQVWSDNERKIRLRCVKIAIKPNHKVILFKQNLRKCCKNKLLDVLLFFGCIVVHSPLF